MKSRPKQHPILAYVLLEFTADSAVSIALRLGYSSGLRTLTYIYTCMKHTFFRHKCRFLDLFRFRHNFMAYTNKSGTCARQQQQLRQRQQRRRHQQQQQQHDNDDDSEDNDEDNDDDDDNDKMKTMTMLMMMTMMFMMLIIIMIMIIMGMHFLTSHKHLSETWFYLLYMVWQRSSIS